MIPDISHTTARSVAQSLCAAVAEPFRSDADLVLHVRASIGVAMAPEDGADAQTLMRRADSAMYRAKALGGGAALYASEQDDSSPERLRMAGELHDATRLVAVQGDAAVFLLQGEAHAVLWLYAWSLAGGPTSSAAS